MGGLVPITCPLVIEFATLSQLRDKSGYVVVAHTHIQVQLVLGFGDCLTGLPGH
jgi:hypothetical protein